VPAPAPQKKAESPASSSTTTDKQKLDALINKNVPALGPATPAVVPKQ
jgi:hypothetical protein